VWDYGTTHRPSTAAGVCSRKRRARTWVERVVDGQPPAPNPRGSIAARVCSLTQCRNRTWEWMFQEGSINHHTTSPSVTPTLPPPVCILPQSRSRTWAKGSWGRSANQGQPSRGSTVSGVCSRKRGARTWIERTEDRSANQHSTSAKPFPRDPSKQISFFKTRDSRINTQARYTEILLPSIQVNSRDSTVLFDIGNPYASEY